MGIFVKLFPNKSSGKDTIAVQASKPELPEPDAAAPQTPGHSAGGDRPFQGAPIEWKQAKVMSGQVVVPPCMTQIRDRLFEDNRYVTDIVVPGNVKTIGDRAFADCVSLQSVTLEQGIEEIGTDVFSGCRSLREVIYPDSVKRCDGRAFRDVPLSRPVTNVSGTMLIHCPADVAGSEWTVPEGVRVIGAKAFGGQGQLAAIRLPEGLEEIRYGAFSGCALTQAEIPASVRRIGRAAFASCKRLEKMTLLGADTQVENSAIYGCTALKEIAWSRPLDPDEKLHLMGLPFLDAAKWDDPNLDHASDSMFSALTSRCATGDARAMYELSRWFDALAERPEASPFYRRAANYWRYRAHSRGVPEARAWFRTWFDENPDARPESVLPEAPEWMSFARSGKSLNAVGFSFFDPERFFLIDHVFGAPLLEVSAYESSEGPDEDGFGREECYDWWYLDGNMQPLPGIERLNAAHWKRRTSTRFPQTIKRAKEILRARGESCMDDLPFMDD